MDGLISFNNRPLRLAIYARPLPRRARRGLRGGDHRERHGRRGDAPGYITLLVAIVGLGGIQMMILGLIGEYIGRIYYESKRRPHFVVRETNARGLPGRRPGRGTAAGGADAPQDRSEIR